MKTKKDPIDVLDVLDVLDVPCGILLLLVIVGVITTFAWCLFAEYRPSYTWCDRVEASNCSSGYCRIKIHGGYHTSYTPFFVGELLCYNERGGRLVPEPNPKQAEE